MRSARAWALLWRSLQTGAACFAVTVGVLGGASERVVLGFWAVGVVVTAVGEWALARWSRAASEVTVVQPDVRDERVVVFKRRDLARDTKPDAVIPAAKPELTPEVPPVAVAEGGRRRRRRAAKSPARATAGGQA